MQQNNKKRKAAHRTRLSLGIQLAVFALAADAAAINPMQTRPVSNAAQVQPQGGYHDFDVPALSLDEGLVLLARQAGVEVYLGSNDLTGTYGNPVKGRLSLEAALQQLLANQALIAAFDPLLRKSDKADVVALTSSVGAEPRAFRRASRGRLGCVNQTPVVDASAVQPRR